MRRHRKSEGFNLAFLDIMSCGLGAIILVFMMVKHNVGSSELQEDLLTQDVLQLQKTELELEKALVESKNHSDSEKKKIATLHSKIASLKRALAQKESSLLQKENKIGALKNDIKSTPIAKTDDVIEDDRGGEENYLMGLKVEGKRIAILLDSSASMTDEKLIDIIRRKNGSTSEKQRGQKWERTKKIMHWLLTRVPKQSTMTVVTFNDTASLLGSLQWLNPRNAKDLSKAYKEVDKLIPTGPTNLQKGLKMISSLSPTDLYVITDGLPTAGDSHYSSLNPFASCGSLLGRGKTISGKCRVALFRQTIQESAPSGVKVNVILLPIEGDPDAANEYWSWTARTGGLLISPAENWP